MNGNALILHDNKPIMSRAINLGDRVLTDGFYNILKQHTNLNIVSGGRKNFPYFNMANFRGCTSESEIENKFNKLLANLLKKNKNNIAIENKLFNIFHHNQISNSVLFSYLNRRFAEKYSKTISETLSPFLFRNLYFFEQVKKIQNADVVLCNTGGLIADHLEFYLPAYLFECFLAKKMGKPVITMNQTISVRKMLNYSMVAMVYKMLDCHMTREPISTNVLMNMGIDEKQIISSCDSAFAADYEADSSLLNKLVKRNRISTGGIGISIRGDRPVDFTKISNTINLLKQEINKPVFFFASCKAHDMSVYKKLTKMCEIQYIEDLNDYRLLTNLLKYLDIVITDRYHSAIFSIIAKTPLLAFRPQTTKLEGLFQLIPVPYKVETLSEAEPKTIVENVKITLNQKKYISAIFADAQKQLKTKAIEDVLSVLKHIKTLKS